MHGTRMMSKRKVRKEYGREVVMLKDEGRWVFLNTLFSVSEACIYMQVGHTAHKQCMLRLGSHGAFNMASLPALQNSKLECAECYLLACPGALSQRCYCAFFCLSQWLPSDINDKKVCSELA